MTLIQWIKKLMHLRWFAYFFYNISPGINLLLLTCSKPCQYANLSPGRTIEILCGGTFYSSGKIADTECASFFCLWYN